MRSSRTSLFFLVLVLSLSGIILAAGDFGESSTSLGQFTDEFTSLDNVSVLVLIERNITLNAMELNFTSGIPQYEDFTSYTETDPSNRITVNSATLFTWIQLDRNDGVTHLQKDYGAAYFDQNFVYSWIFNITQLEAGDADNRDYGYNLCFTNNAGDPLVDPRITMLVTQSGADDTQYKTELRIDDPHGGFDIDTSILLDVATAYYTTLSRVAGDVLVLVFRTGSFSGPVKDLLAVTLVNFDDSFRYILPIFAKSSATDPADWMSGTSEFLWNQSGASIYRAEGYFTTEDYLTQANGSTLVQLTNATIPGGTGIEIQFSEDNATWVNNLGIAGSNTLNAGFQSIDLRELNWSGSYYLRYNFSGPQTATPRLYQSRLITTLGAVGPGAPGLNISRETVTYNLTEIGVIRGTLDAGNLNSTRDIDGDMFNVSEVVGAPGMMISGNFSGVDPEASCLWVVIYSLYDGNLNHDFDIEMWNFTGSAWVEDAHIPDMVAFEWTNSTIYGLRTPGDFLSGGEVRVRLDHETAGNINHDLFIEYFKLLAEIPAGPTPGAGIVTIVESDIPWLAIAIILSIISFLLARERW